MHNDSIPYGYCQCGCGEKTNVAARNRYGRGEIKGQPQRFLPGHVLAGKFVRPSWSWTADRSVAIPLWGRDGMLRATVIVDAQDVYLAAERWRLHGGGYAFRGTHSGAILLHREIMGLTAGDAREVDHIDRDRLNCRRANLRVCERFENAQNQGARKGSTSSYRGVSRRKDGRWVANCMLAGKQHYLGLFATELEAASAAARFRRQHMPYSIEGTSV